MFTDIVFPQNNENEFISLAKRLDISKLVFCYEYPDFKQNKQQNKAVIVNPQNIRKAKNHQFPLISSRNDRFLFEQKYKFPLILHDLEKIAKFDSLHSRHSGLNHILCRLSNKNNIILGISFSQLLNATPLKRAQILGRMLQNIRLAKKYKMKIKLASFATSPYEMRAPKDLESLGILLGLHPTEAKQALNEELS